jgi:hypothetical protein
LKQVQDQNAELVAQLRTAESKAKVAPVAGPVADADAQA